MVWLGIVLALVTSASWAVGNVLTQRVGQLIGPPRAMLWSMIAGGSLAVPFAVLIDTREQPITRAVAIWAVVAAISGVVAYIGLFFAFTNAKLTTAVPLVSSWPLVAGVVSVALLGESLRGLQIGGAAAVIAGVLLVAIPRPSARDVDVTTDTYAPPSGSRLALLAGVASSVGFGVMIPAMGRIAPSTGAFGATAIVYGLGIALAGSIGKAAGLKLGPPPRSAWLLVLATGAVETLGFVTVALARRFAPMSVVAPVASLASTLTVLYAWAVLKERPYWLALIGALLAGAGVVLLAV